MNKAHLINNFVFLISYNLWKGEQDTVYNKIKTSFKISWLNSSFSLVHNQMISTLLVFIALIFPIFIYPLNAFIHPSWTLICIFGIIFLSLLNIIKFHLFVDRYIDEKYLELSKQRK